MVSIALRIIAGLLLLPPFTPIGLLLWYYAHRRDKKAKQRHEAVEQLNQINQNLEKQ